MSETLGGVFEEGYEGGVDVGLVEEGREKGGSTGGAGVCIL